MKKILIVVGVLVVLVVVGAVLLLTNLGAVIKATVERVGSEATQSKVALSSADVSLTSGQGTLGGLVVGNPKGFSSGSAIETDEMRVHLDTASIQSDVIVIKEVVVAGPRMTYELNSSFSSNLGALQANVDAFGRRFGSGGDKKEPAADGSGKRIRIEHFRVTGGKVSLAAGVAGAVSANLPEIDMKDLGGKDGIAPEKLASEILSVLLDQAVAAAAQAGFADRAKEAFGGAVDKARDALGGLLDGSKDDDAKKDDVKKGDKKREKKK